MTKTKRRLTAQDFLKAHPPKCKRCRKVLEKFDDMHRIMDFKGERVKALFCIDCIEPTLEELRQSRIVETYKDVVIYGDGKDFTYYWGSYFNYKSLEACRTGIDRNRK